MSSPKIKNIPLGISVNRNYIRRILGPHEGRFAIVTERRAGVVMDALASGVDFVTPDENAEAYGEVVWSWRRDAGVKSAGAIRSAMVTTSPLTRESTI